MMRKKIIRNKILSFSAFIVSWTTMQGQQVQFNTIRNPIIEENIFKIKENPIREKEEKEKGNWFTNLFKGTKHKKELELKREIDSLKLQIENNKSGIESKLKEIKELIVIEKEKEEAQTTKKEDEYPKKEKFKIHLPLSKLEITSKYGNRIHPINGIIQKHQGIDLKANNEKVFSVLKGEVIDVGFDDKGGGNYVKIRHFHKDIETSYLHLKEILCKKGDIVKSGDVIGISGKSGNVTAPHLHFSVKINGEYENPIKFLRSLIKLKFNI